MCRNCQNIIHTLQEMREKRETLPKFGSPINIFSLNTQISPQKGKNPTRKIQKQGKKG